MEIAAIQRRYEIARAAAEQAIDDLTSGGEADRVYEAVETSLLWKLALATNGKIAIDTQVLGEMLQATQG